MNLFPTTIYPSFDYEMQQIFNTAVSVAGRKRQTKQIWEFPLRQWTLNFKVLESDDMTTLWNFFNSQCGQAHAFYFYEYATESYELWRLEDGDGSSTLFDLRAKNVTSSNLTVYVDEVETTAYTFQSGTGVYSSDQILFTTAPDDTALIQVDITGQLRFTAAFTDDSMSKKQFTDILYSTGLQMQEVIL